MGVSGTSSVPTRDVADDPTPHGRPRPLPAAQITTPGRGGRGPVVQLVTRLNIGGVAAHVLLLGRELAADRSTTVAAGHPAAVEGEMNDPAVAVRHVPLVRPLRPATDARAVAAVRHLLVETGATVLHTHMAKAGSVGRLAALSLPPRRRPRTVHTFHGHVLDGYFSPGVQRAFVEVERRLAARTDALVAVSDEVRDALLDLRIGRPSQYQVVGYGLDLGRFLAVDGPSGRLRGPLGLGPDVPLVGVLGRLVAIKDHATLLAAVAKLPGVHLAVIGDGELRTVLEAEASWLGLSGRVHFTGWWADVPGALADLDVVALTSRNEGTPMALIEAAAAARPVVATGVGGVAAVVDDGVTGYVVGAGDIEAVAARLASLLADGPARERLGRAARASISDRFGPERLLHDVRALYASLD
jgi:glycosyltransferase involved in cell wall biosynthesis